MLKYSSSFKTTLHFAFTEANNSLEQYIEQQSISISQVRLRNVGVWRPIPDQLTLWQ